MNKVTDADLTWLGCSLDTEGCIAAHLLGPNRKNQCLTVYFGNSDWDLIEKYRSIVQKITGAIPTVKIQRHHGQDFYRVNIYKKPFIKLLLSAVLRYLVKKKPQGALLYHLCVRRWKWHERPEWVQEYVDRISWFNGHRRLPDGSYGPTASWLTRQSRGKPSQDGTRRDCTGNTHRGEETVHSVAIAA